MFGGDCDTILQDSGVPHGQSTREYMECEIKVQVVLFNQLRKRRCML